MHKVNEKKIFLGIKHGMKNTTIISAMRTDSMRITNIGAVENLLTYYLFTNNFKGSDYRVGSARTTSKLSS
jgi:hypothetical protein